MREKDTFTTVVQVFKEKKKRKEKEEKITDYSGYLSGKRKFIKNFRIYETRTYACVEILSRVHKLNKLSVIYESRENVKIAVLRGEMFAQRREKKSLNH